MAGPRTKPDNALGQQVLARRRALGLSQQQLAKQAGISCPYVCQLETGKVKSPTISIGIALAQALGVEIETLVQWIKDPHEDRPRCDHCGQELDLETR